MKNIFLFAAILLLSITVAKSQTFTLKSNDISGQLTNKQVFSGFGCEGENISPQLLWENVPEGTKSFAVTVYDAKAPTGSGWWHCTDKIELSPDTPAAQVNYFIGANTIEKASIISYYKR